MKSLNYLECNEITEFDLIVAGKHKATRERLSALRHRVEEGYNIYIDNFDSLPGLPPSTFNQQESDDLRNCYLVSTIARDLLLRKIITAQTIQFQHYCPYCLIGSPTTYDHYVPEGAFPVYSVLARNLVPCCGTCNGKKLQYWRENGARAIIHYYNDLIPSIQFLFGDLTLIGNIPSITFHLEHTPGISDAMFNIIRKHFERLDLLTRYEDNLGLLISEIVDDVDDNRQEFGDLVTIDAIKRIILRKSDRFKTYFGTSNWKSVTLDVLANSQEFLETL